jgi:hypothetical protein
MRGKSNSRRRRQTRNDHHGAVNSPTAIQACCIVTTFVVLDQSSGTIRQGGAKTVIGDSETLLVDLKLAYVRF